MIATPHRSILHATRPSQLPYGTNLLGRFIKIFLYIGVGGMGEAIIRNEGTPLRTCRDTSWGMPTVRQRTTVGGVVGFPHEVSL